MRVRQGSRRSLVGQWTVRTPSSPQGVRIGRPLIVDEAKRHLASYQKPKSVSFVDSLPKAPTGKILKRELRKLYGGS